MKKNVFKEYTFFRSQSQNIKTLLITNMLYALILPVIEIFVGAYIMRNTGSPTYVAIYQLCMYFGILVTSVFNGLMMKRYSAQKLYAFGILLSAMVLMVMMFVKFTGMMELGLSGFVLGASTGFFWTNRYLLTLNSTTDENRNYFFGLESFFFSLWSIVVPLIIGAFLGSVNGFHFLGKVLDVNNGYQVITVFSLFIAILACVVLSKGNFVSPLQSKFFHIHFHVLWKKMLALAGLKGMVQGFLVTAPAILVMRLVGDESALGLIQGIGGLLTAILVYALGRLTQPKHRMIIFGVGLLVFFMGTVFNAFLFSAIGVIVFVLCKVLFQPLHDLAYFPTMMKTIDAVKAIEKRTEYTYILSHEIGLFFGRAFGMGLFILLAYMVSEDFALRYALMIVAAIQLLSLSLAKNIIHDIDNKYHDSLGYVRNK